MAFYDLPRGELERYKPDRREEKDFDSFWAATLAEAASRPLDPRFAPWAGGLDAVEVFDASFAGFDGQRVAAWLVLPAVGIRSGLPACRGGKLPCLVEYIGYGGGRSFPWDWLF